MATKWVIPQIHRKRAEPYLKAFKDAEQKHGLPEGLLARIAYQESRFNKDAVSPAGAVGLMQFMPATAKHFGINPRDPFQSIEAAGQYLGKLYKRFGKWDLAIAAYNAGEGNVEKYGRRVPPFKETREYVASVTKDLNIA